MLRYTDYYGDGDSKAFDSVKDIYGKASVTKLECIGHIQKRVGTRLRKLKSRNKGLGGEGKLTDALINKLQNYYGIAIRSNIRNLDKMQSAVIAAFFHCCSSKHQPKHGQCPVGDESWFDLAIPQNDHQARHRLVEWAQKEIAVVPDFHKRNLFNDEAHFWLNGYVNKQNCRIWCEANPQVYVETPLHPEKLTVWCALWAGGILLQKR
ncbi:uncharacterized protein TNCV_3156441 [Trichonephila clavipes]|nr:uncharacterized protein TNCV_3156441 [Trichonephila clavipes]